MDFQYKVYLKSSKHIIIKLLILIYLRKIQTTFILLYEKVNSLQLKSYDLMEGSLNPCLNFCFIGCSTLVGQSPMKSPSSVCLFVCLSIHPSVSFLKIGSLVDHGGDWRSQIFEKRVWWSEFGSNGPKSGPK